MRGPLCAGGVRCTRPRTCSLRMLSSSKQPRLVLPKGKGLCNRPSRSCGGGSGVATVLVNAVGSVNPLPAAILSCTHTLGRRLRQRRAGPAHAARCGNIAPHPQATNSHHGHVHTAPGLNEAALIPLQTAWGISRFPQTHRRSCRASDSEPSKGPTGPPLGLVPRAHGTVFPPQTVYAELHS